MPMLMDAITFSIDDDDDGDVPSDHAAPQKSIYYFALNSVLQYE